MTYKETAKELGIRWHLWKYGIKFLQKDPSGNVYKLVSIIPLDGWILDPKEVNKFMKERDYEL